MPKITKINGVPIANTSVSSFTYTNNVFTISDTDGVNYSALINTMTGLTVNGSFSATTYLGLPTDIVVTGGTYTNGTATFTNNTGGTFNVTGFSTSTGSAFTGGTVTGATYISNSFSANTISATTYYGLPIDIIVTGFTYNDANTFTITNNTGGTLSVIANTFTGLTTTTISATTYQNLPISTAGNLFNYYNFT